MAAENNVTKKIHVIPDTKMGYTGIRIPNHDVLTEFKFTAEQEWSISKVFQTLWLEGFETGPVKWDRLPCQHHSHVNNCANDPNFWACVERPVKVDVNCGPWRAQWGDEHPTGGYQNWMFYPNFYSDKNGNLAGYEIAEEGLDSKYCLKIKTYDLPVVPTHLGKPGGYGGAWVYLRDLNIPQQMSAGKFYRLSFYSKLASTTTNNGQVIVDAQDGFGKSNSMRYHFTPTTEWVKHEHLFELDKVYDWFVIWSEASHHEFLIDNIKLEEIEVTRAHNSKNVLWDFGDGTYGTGLTAKHVYTWPGVYPIRTVFYNEYGQPLENTVVETITAYNVLEDSLNLDYSVPNFTAEIPAGEQGFDKSIPPFKVLRTNSWQSYPNLSGSNYSLFLHASGSLSNRLNVDRFYNEKWSHLDQTWAFYTSATTTDGAIDWLPASSINTTSEKIFYRWRYDSNNDLVIRQCAETDAGACFVGTSGIGEFKYIDDLPKHNFPDPNNTSNESVAEPVVLIATQDIESFPSERVTTITHKENANQSGKSLSEAPKLTIPVKTIPTPGHNFKITATGQSVMPITNIKWQNTAIPFFISVVNDNGYITESYPPLSGSIGYVTGAPGALNIGLYKGSSSTGISAKWYTDDLAQLPSKVNSRLYGFIVPQESSFDDTYTGATLSAFSSLVRPNSALSGIQTLPNPGRDYIVLNKNNKNTICKVISLKDKNTGQGGFVKYDVPADSKWNQTGELYGTATSIDTFDKQNPHTTSWFADASLNRLLKVDSNGVIKKVVRVDDEAGHHGCSPLTGLNMGTGQTVGTFQTPLTGCTIGLFGVAIDESKNVWVTAHDAGFISKFDTDGTHMLTISSAALTGISIVTSISALSSVKPAAIDTDVDSNVWVSFNDPLSCFVQKFNGVTGDPVTGFFNLFDPGERPVDLVVDSHNDVFVITNCWSDNTSTVTTTGQSVSAFREVSTAQYPFLTNMGYRIDGTSENFAYAISGNPVVAVPNTGEPGTGLLVLPTSATMPTSGHGAIKITGFDNVRNIPGLNVTNCDSVYNGWSAVINNANVGMARISFGTFYLSGATTDNLERNIHGLQGGEAVTFYGTAPSGADTSTTYYVSAHNINTITLHTTVTGAANGTDVLDLSGGVGNYELIDDAALNNNVLYTRHHLTKQYIGAAAQNYRCDRNYSLTTITHKNDVEFELHPGGRLYKFSGVDGSLLYTVSGLYAPSHVTVDKNQNVWVADHVDRLLGFVNTDGSAIGEVQAGNNKEILRGYGAHISDPEIDGITQQVFTPVDQHITGLACDLDNRLNVINSFENRVYFIQVSGTSANLKKTRIELEEKDAFRRPINGYRMPYQAFGDFTGFDWFNKYQYYPEIDIVGTSISFNIYPSGGQYNISKINENYDAAETIKSYRQQEFLINSKVFFDDFYGEIVGDGESDPMEIGKLTYEKISNFILNHSDVDTCNVNSLYSYCLQQNIPIANYNLPYPPALKRVVDLGSIKHKKLWGERSKNQTNFDLDHPAGSDISSNLGNKIPLSAVTTTYMVTAGEPIILRQLFNNEFKVITPMVIDNPKTFGSNLYTLSTFPLTSYPLSSYSSNWGWNIDPDAVNPSVSGVEIANYYDFYEFKPGFENTQLEGVIDWTSSNTVVESQSGINDWIKGDGILENMIEYQIRKGTYSFDDSSSGGTEIGALDPSKLTPLRPTINVSVPNNMNVYSIDGERRPTIYLRKGSLTQFIMDSTTTGHPFRLFTDPKDLTSVYTDGVTITNNAAGTGGILSIIPTSQAPSMLYYGSLSGTNMGYSIVFV